MLRAGLPGPCDETGEPPPPSPPSSPRLTKLFVPTRSGAHGAPPCRDVSVPDEAGRRGGSLICCRGQLGGHTRPQNLRVTTYVEALELFRLSPTRRHGDARTLLRGAGPVMISPRLFGDVWSLRHLEPLFRPDVDMSPG